MFGRATGLLGVTRPDMARPEHVRLPGVLPGISRVAIIIYLQIGVLLSETKEVRPIVHPVMSCEEMHNGSIDIGIVSCNPVARVRQVRIAARVARVGLGSRTSEFSPLVKPRENIFPRSARRCIWC